MAVSTLDWAELSTPPHMRMLAWYRALLDLRRAEPCLSDPRLDRVSVTYDAVARWVVVTRGSLRVICNLASEAQVVPLDASVVSVLLTSWDGILEISPPELPSESVAVVRVAGPDA